MHLHLHLGKSVAQHTLYGLGCALSWRGTGLSEGFAGSELHWDAWRKFSSLSYKVVTEGKTKLVNYFFYQKLKFLKTFFFFALRIINYSSSQVEKLSEKLGYTVSLQAREQLHEQLNEGSSIFRTSRTLQGMKHHITDRLKHPWLTCYLKETKRS